MPEASLLTRTLRIGSYGADVYGVKRTVLRGLDKQDGGRRLKALETPRRWETAGMHARRKRTLGPFFVVHLNRMRALLGFKRTGVADQALWKAMLVRDYSDEFAIQLMNRYIDTRPKPPVVPSLGPVWLGGKSVLQHDCTHATDGIPLYPAFDDAYMQGRSIIAPEDMTVESPSSSNPGQAFYATGVSSIDYWFGHLDRTHARGTRFRKGQTIGRVAPNSIGGGPHVHVGVNVERLWGRGRQLAHHTDYTHGAPTIGAQLVSRNL